MQRVVSSGQEVLILSKMAADMVFGKTSIVLSLGSSSSDESNDESFGRDSDVSESQSESSFDVDDGWNLS